jgi:PAB-dependent poly(A)-specific ribonuclease subunit 2
MRPAHRPTPEIDPEILKSMKVVGTIGYARNMTNLKRNVVRYPNLKSRPDLPNQGRPGHGGHYHNHSIDEGDMAINSQSSAVNLVPKYYRKVAIKMGKLGTDDFDFDRYNRTGFCGLEASLPNAYSNPLLFILYYSERLRVFILNHTCWRENCICCELSFLFHMMDISPGMPCQSSNFLRALRTIPEASALGLVFTDQAAVWLSNVPRLVQSFIRFILQQIHVQISSTVEKNSTKKNCNLSSPHKLAKALKAEDMGKEISAALDQPRSMDQESNDEESLFSQLFGMMQEKVNVCTRCKTKKAQNQTVLLCNLMYPDKHEDKKHSFQDIVCSSMCPEQTTPAWCDTCKKYQTTSQTRNLLSLPNILCLNAGMDSAQDVAFWTAQMEHLYLEKGPKNEANHAEVAPKLPESLNRPSVMAKPCRYGNACSRPDCKFSHPVVESAPQEPVKTDIGAKCAAADLSWVPSQMSLQLHKSGKLEPPPSSSSANEDESTADEVISSKDYELYAITWAILDPATGKAINIVATVNVGPTYHARVGSPVI